MMLCIFFFYKSAKTKGRACVLTDYNTLVASVYQIFVLKFHLLSVRTNPGPLVLKDYNCHNSTKTLWGF